MIKRIIAPLVSISFASTSFALNLPATPVKNQNTAQANVLALLAQMNDKLSNINLTQQNILKSNQGFHTQVLLNNQPLTPFPNWTAVEKNRSVSNLFRVEPTLSSNQVDNISYSLSNNRTKTVYQTRISTLKKLITQASESMHQNASSINPSVAALRTYYNDNFTQKLNNASTTQLLRSLNTLLALNANIQIQRYRQAQTTQLLLLANALKNNAPTGEK